MTARRANARICSNPVCGAMIERDRVNSIEIIQIQTHDAGTMPARWLVCDLDCARQYLALSDVKARAAAEVER